jgi:hypothetical protein
MAFDGPALVNVFTDPNALAMPPKIEFEQVKGMAVSMTKLMLNGHMDEVLDTVKSNYKHLKDLLYLNPLQMILKNRRRRSAPAEWQLLPGLWPFTAARTPRGS